MSKRQPKLTKREKRIVKKASDQADHIMANAKSEASLAKDKVMKEAKREISDVVVIALSKIAGDELTAEQKKNLTSQNN